MSELKIAAIGEGNCAECSHDKKGVGFRINGQVEFMCWEHFRLLMEAMNPTRVASEPASLQRVLCWRCFNSCCWHCGRTYTPPSYSVCQCQTRGQTVSHSTGETETLSQSEGTTRSHGRSISHSTSRTTCESEGDSHS